MFHPNPFSPLLFFSLGPATKKGILSACFFFLLLCYSSHIMAFVPSPSSPSPSNAMDPPDAEKQRFNECLHEIQIMLQTWIQAGGFDSLDQSYDWPLTMFRWLHHEKGCPSPEAKTKCPLSCPSRSGLVVKTTPFRSKKRPRSRRRYVRGPQIKIAIGFV
jgi:hypothetical protein